MPHYLKFWITNSLYILNPKNKILLMKSILLISSEIAEEIRREDGRIMCILCILAIGFPKFTGYSGFHNN